MAVSGTVFDFPYPWHAPVAQELHRLLYQLFPSQQQATFVAAKAGADLAMILQQQPVAMLWKDILEQLATSDRMHALLETVLTQLPADHSYRDFFIDLNEQRPVTLAAGMGGDDRSTRLLGSSDDVSEREALLYKDDLTISTGRIPALIKTLQKLSECATGVCKITADFNGTDATATGFRIGDNVLLTCWHAIHSFQTGKPAEAVHAEFGYEESPDGELGAFTPTKCSIESIVADQNDDWAIIRTSTLIDEACRIIPLEATQAEVEKAAYIVQHPGGARKRLGFVRNQICDVTTRFVYYLTDTQPGSSGAPVFDEAGRLIALHRGGNPTDDDW